MKNIWQVPAYLSYVQPTLTEEMVLDAERSLGYKLPKEYIELLNVQNGGYIRYTIEGLPHGQIFGIGPHFPSLTDCDLSDYESTVSFELNGLIPFDGDGHWNICLDYRKNNDEPEITLIDTECDSEEKVANNFKEYLNLLIIDTEYEYVIDTDAALEEVVQKISKALDVQFEAPDSLDYGYTLYRGQYKECWISVSPNKSPSGFIEEEDERYNELQSQTKTTALRYPEISENALLINIYDDTIRAELLAEMTKNEFKIIALEHIIYGV